MRTIMKVSELLIKTVNGEEVPKKIKYNGYIYSYVERNRLFAKYIKEPFNAKLPCFLFIDISDIDDEIEIIEDETIKHIKKTYDITKFANDYPEAATLLKDIVNKQYEIIDEINRGK